DNSGFRIIDLAVARQSPLEFTVVWVDNHGPFAREWWWYYNVTGPQILELQKKHGAHVLDVEVMTIKPDAKFAVVLVKDPGSNADYGWTAGSIPSTKMDSYLKSLLNDGKRLIAFNPNPQLPDYTTSVEAPNRSPGYAWWVYVNSTPEFIGQKLQENSARIVDIEHQPGGKFSAVMIK